jgi:hypothetical protein
MGIMDLDRDGSDEIILGGVNNAYGLLPGFEHPMTIVVLDSRRVEGQGSAPPTDDRHFKGLSSGHERAVLFFRRFGQLPTDDPNDFCAFQNIRPDGEHFEAIARKLSNGDIGAHYQFDAHLNLDMILPQAALAALLDKKIRPELTQTERLKAYVQQLGDVKVLKNDLATPPQSEPK